MKIKTLTIKRVNLIAYQSCMIELCIHSQLTGKIWPRLIKNQWLSEWEMILGSKFQVDQHRCSYGTILTCQLNLNHILSEQVLVLLEGSRGQSNRFRHGCHLSLRHTQWPIQPCHHRHFRRKIRCHRLQLWLFHWWLFQCHQPKSGDHRRFHRTRAHLSGHPMCRHLQLRHRWTSLHR